MDYHKILIIEHDKESENLLKEVIGFCAPNFVYVSVDDGDEALKLADVIDFDLVFLNTSISGKNGYEVLKSLKKNDLYQKVPVIALAPKSANSIKDSVLNSGFSELISKPFNPQDLVEIFKKYFDW